MSQIEPIPADHPHLADDPLYQAMTAAEKLQHRRMLAQMWRMREESKESDRKSREEREVYFQEHPEERPVEERILALLESIDAKLDRMLDLSRQELLRAIDERMGTVLEQIREETIRQEKRS
jgi:hypothetical protein